MRKVHIILIQKNIVIVGTTIFLGASFYFSNTFVQAESINEDNNTIISGLAFYEKPRKKQYLLKQDVALDSGLDFNNIDGVLPKGMGVEGKSYLGNVLSSITGSLLFGNK
ncbi:hypothetical protein D920_00072 [Enterococcus faecalis 13-SD-W-01]|nr:hypothetical protein D920_00072 [Enterococcus faecalis 13-SD-W-01]